MNRGVPFLLATVLVPLGFGAAPSHAAPVTALAFSPDGAALVSNGDRGIDIRSPKDAAIERHFDCDLPKITSLGFSRAGTLLAAGGGDPGVSGEVRLFSWPEGTPVGRFGNHTDLVNEVAFDADGKRLAVASSDGTGRIWKVEAEKNNEGGRGGVKASVAITLTGHAGAVLGIAISPSGRSVVTVSADRSLKVWSTEDGRLLRSLGQHTEVIHAVAFRPRLTADEAGPVACASAGDDRTVRVWHPELGRMVRIVRHHDGPILALAWARDGSSLFSAGKEGVIRRIDAESDTIHAAWHAHDDWIYSLATSPDGSTLASGDWTGRVRIHILPPR